MIFRQARPAEIGLLFSEGYKVWSKNRTFEQYCLDNGKEDAYGTRYVIEVAGEVVSSAILLNLPAINAKKAFGIGSVLTPKTYAGKGYATKLLKNCINNVYGDNTLIFLFSDINPFFYERLGFRLLPPHLQKNVKSPCMALCKDNVWNELMNCSLDTLPNYF